MCEGDSCLAGVTVAVVGATCPLGLGLVDALLASGRKVRALSRSATVPAHWRLHPGFQSGRCTLEDPARLLSGVSGCREVIWLAHAYAGKESPCPDDCNSAALSALCDAPGLHLRRIVLLSSGGSVYGAPREIPVGEFHPRRPQSAYGRSKKRMEDVLRARAECNGWSGAILRPGNIYGPHYLSTRAKGVIGAFVRALRSGQPFKLVADGSAVRDFVHEDDVIRAIVHALDWRSSVAWNVGAGVGTQIRDVLDRVCDALGRRPTEVKSVAAPPSDPREMVLDCSRLRRDTGWRPAIAFDSGLRSMLRPVAEELARASRFPIPGPACEIRSERRLL